LTYKELLGSKSSLLNYMLTAEREIKKDASFKTETSVDNNISTLGEASLILILLKKIQNINA